MSALPPPNYAQSTPPPLGGGYYPPPPGSGERQNYQQPVHSYQVPSSSPGYSQQQAYPPPPSQPSQANHGNYPPPPPLQQQYLDNAHNASYQPHLQSPPLQANPSYSSEQTSNQHPQPFPKGDHDEQPFGQEEKPLKIPQSSQLAGGVSSASQLSDETSSKDEIGSGDGYGYRISHRDCNTMLTLHIAPLFHLFAKPGVMIAMDPKVTVKGKFSMAVWNKLKGGEMISSEYIGPGEIKMAPPFLGDIQTLHFPAPGNDQSWKIGKDAFIACTEDVKKTMKRQDITKAFFSGEGLFTYELSGQKGTAWIASFGAIIRKDLGPGEKYIIDNGHLVAWNCEYAIKRVSSGGLLSNHFTGEGLVCEFQGPGTVFMQTRNPTAFGMYMGGFGAQK